MNLSWQAEGRMHLSANGQPVPGFPATESGSLDLEVRETTRFVLTALRDGLTVTATRTVRRVAVPPALAESEPNDDLATDAVASGLILGTLSVPEADTFVVDVPAAGYVRATVWDGAGGCTLPALLVLFDANGLAVEASQGFGDGQCPIIDPTLMSAAGDLAAGRYYLQVSIEHLSGRQLPYRLEVEVGYPGCGNHVFERSRGEECDDGNPVSGDLCDPSCNLELTGRTTGPGAVETFRDAIDPAHLSDFYRVELTAPGRISAETGAPTLEAAPRRTTRCSTSSMTVSATSLIMTTSTSLRTSAPASSRPRCPPGYTMSSWSPTPTS